MYEHKSKPLLTRRQFFRRMAGHAAAGGALVGGSMVVGIAGYMLFARMSFVDAFLNSCMLLGGMGPVGELPDAPAKVFAGLFALYAGLILIVVAGILIAPIVHRILHKLHLEEQEPAAAHRPAGHAPAAPQAPRRS